VIGPARILIFLCELKGVVVTVNGSFGLAQTSDTSSRECTFADGARLDRHASPTKCARSIGDECSASEAADVFSGWLRRKPVAGPKSSASHCNNLN
jgi:hypothetical protein